jgi:hypothetical protein
VVAAENLLWMARYFRVPRQSLSDIPHLQKKQDFPDFSPPKMILILAEFFRPFFFRLAGKVQLKLPYSSRHMAFAPLFFEECPIGYCSALRGHSGGSVV